MTPDTQVQSSGTSVVGDVPVIGDVPLLGLTLGGANLIPIKIDATAEYLPQSDFAAWPNPFTMTNNAAAGLFPTYILRNQSLDTLSAVLIDQITTQLGAGVTDYLDDPGDNPQLGPKLNIYVTIPARSLPLLEPTYLAYDVVNLLTGANLNNPIGAALSPALTSLVNLGYADVEYNPTTGVYERTLDEADVPTAFGTLPADVDWGKVPAHLVDNLVTGIQKAIDDGLVSQTPVSNPIKTLLGLLGVGGSSNLSGLEIPDLAELGNGGGTQSIAKTSSEPEGIAQADIGTEELVVNKSKVNVRDDTKKLTAAADDAREEVEKSVKAAGERTRVSAEKARNRTAKAFKDAQERVNSVAEDGRKQIKAAAEGVEKGVQKAANDVKDNVKKAGDSVKPAKKAKEKAKKKDAA